MNIQQLEAWIRAGEGAKVRDQLPKSANPKIPREKLRWVTHYAWRSDVPLVGVRLLNRLVRPLKGRPSHATQEEKAEYAACLIKLGMSREALELLSEIPTKNHPRVLLYRSLALVKTWDYEATIPLLKEYISHPLVNEYQSRVGSVNLASALVYVGRTEEASHLLDKLLNEARDRQWTLLRSNCLELKAENLIHERKFKEAQSLLLHANDELKGSDSVHAFMIKKWLTIVELLQRKGNHNSRKALSTIREAAHRRGHWETLRECDFFEAVAKNNTQALLSLFFGTPFESYRKRITKQFPKDFEIPENFQFRPYPSKQKPIEVDLLLGKTNQGYLKLGQTLHRLLTIFCSDQYRPFRVEELYSQLFPSESYNPFTSGLRVHQTIHFLSRWLRKNKVPLQIQCRASQYRLVANGPVIIRMGRGRPPTKHLFLLKPLALKFPGESFTAKEAAPLLRLAPRTATRVLSEATADGTLVREGKRRLARYRFAA